MEVLLPARYIEKPDFSGNLLSDWDRQNNYFIFRFIFDKIEQMRPLILSVKFLPVISSEYSFVESCNLKEKQIVCKCDLPEYNSPIIKSGLICPDFLLSDYKMEVIDIESKAYCGFGL